jgi:hypothetical protein
VFIKDMAYYIMPPDNKPASIAPSLAKEDTDGAETNGETKSTNPTVIPLNILKNYHFTFLIRHPRRGIPSFYRCCVPPLDEITGFKDFMPNEAGYAELVRLFDYLREQKVVGPAMAGQEPQEGEVTITVIDADDLLDNPKGVIETFCRETGIEYTPDMLSWDDPENQKYVSDAFAKWIGFHNDAINSTKLTARTHGHVCLQPHYSPGHLFFSMRVLTLCVQKTVTEESENEEWRQKYGEEAQKVIRACVNENIPHYEYLKSFAIKV